MVAEKFDCNGSDGTTLCYGFKGLNRKVALAYLIAVLAIMAVKATSNICYNCLKNCVD